MQTTQSPFIIQHRWGEIIVRENGVQKSYKDAKLFPGGSRGWDWNETETHHDPGIQIADVRELVGNGSGVIVLSRGVYKRLKVCKETTVWLDKQDIPYYIQETKNAIETYNDLREKQLVGGLFRSTC